MWIDGLLKKAKDAAPAGRELEDVFETGKVKTVFERRTSRGHVTVFTSGKGGVGKSTVSTTIASLLAESGRRVLLIDTDTGLRTVDAMMGVSETVSANLYDVLERRTRWEDALVTHEGIPNLYILVSDQSRSKESIRKDAFDNLVSQVARYFDHVIIDCPAGVEYGFVMATGCVDEAFIVAIPESPSLRGGAQVVRLLEKRDVSPLRAIINRRVEDLEKHGMAPTADEAASLLGIPVVATIPMDYVVMACNHAGIPLILWDKTACRALDSFRDLVAKLWMNPVLSVGTSGHSVQRGTSGGIFPGAGKKDAETPTPAEVSCGESGKKDGEDAETEGAVEEAV